jgi:aryl-alcohol dehydrogenase-like predicted oxidoreductase
MAQVALAWVLRNPVVSALEAPYTPREPTYFS